VSFCWEGGGLGCLLTCFLAVRNQVLAIARCMEGATELCVGCACRRRLLVMADLICAKWCWWHGMAL
jgi:hypothetical protein